MVSVYPKLKKKVPNVFCFKIKAEFNKVPEFQHVPVVDFKRAYKLPKIKMYLSWIYI